MFLRLGSPSLFLTITCNDFATEYEQLLPGMRPWDDPVLFQQHFKRSFQHVFNTYILKSVSFAKTKRAFAFTNILLKEFCKKSRRHP